MKRIILSGMLIVIGLGVLLVGALAAPVPFPDRQLQGVTFSVPHARGIGLPWQEALSAIVEDLGVRRFRLSAYWNEVEAADNQFDFADLDYQMDLIAQRQGEVILGVGRKLPRWPECHDPAWLSGKTESEIQAEVLEMLEVVVRRYQNHPALRMWQLENEPLLRFGECPPEDRVFLAAEENLLRELDTTHPILITDSGELNSWLGAAQYGDTVGTTMYRTVFSGRTQKPFRYDYIFPAWLYRLKARYVRLLYGKDVLISELQGEPWGAQPFPEMTAEEREQSLSPERFVELADFARRTQLPEAYWWGVEYWYWEKEVNGDDRYWNVAREIFR